MLDHVGAEEAVDQTVKGAKIGDHFAAELLLRIPGPRATDLIAHYFETSVAHLPASISPRAAEVQYPCRRLQTGGKEGADPVGEILLATYESGLEKPRK